MKLSIIITHYKEPPEICLPLWNSLLFQNAINREDIEIIWVQDGEEGTLGAFPWEANCGFEVLHLNLEHGGISKARNAGMDMASGDYIMFCDCDDQFQHAFGLHLMFSAMAKEPDIIGSKFTEENRLVSDYSLIPRENDTTFIHGKAFRKEFLTENGLRFHEDLTKHEDGIFVLMAYRLTTNVQYIHTPFYLWRWNPGSVMRAMGAEKALITTYPDVIRARDYLMQDMKKYGFETRLLVAKSVIDSYYDFQKSEFSDPELVECQRKAKEATYAFYKKYRDEYYSNTPQELAEIMMVSRQLAYSNGMMVERMTLPQFIAYLKKADD